MVFASDSEKCLQPSWGHQPLSFLSVVGTHRIMTTRLILTRATQNAQDPLNIGSHRQCPLLHLKDSTHAPLQTVLGKTRRTIKKNLSQDRTGYAKHRIGSTDPNLMRTWEKILPGSTRDQSEANETTSLIHCGLSSNPSQRWPPVNVWRDSGHAWHSEKT